MSFGIAPGFFSVQIYCPRHALARSCFSHGSQLRMVAKSHAHSVLFRLFEIDGTGLDWFDCI